MPSLLTFDQVYARLCERADYYAAFADSAGIVKGRHRVYSELRRMLAVLGTFPLTASDKIRASVVPFFFQEANYDGIRWTDQDAELGVIRADLDLDYAIWSSGASREDANGATFALYVEHSFAAIDYRKDEALRRRNAQL